MYMLTTSRDIVPFREIMDVFSPTCTLAQIVHLTGLFHLHVHANNSLADTLPQTFRIYPVLSAYSTVVNTGTVRYFSRRTQGTILFRISANISLLPYILSNISLPHSMVAQKEQSAREKNIQSFIVPDPWHFSTDADADPRIRTFSYPIRLRILLFSSVILKTLNFFLFFLSKI